MTTNTMITNNEKYTVTITNLDELWVDLSQVSLPDYIKTKKAIIRFFEKISYSLCQDITLEIESDKTISTVKISSKAYNYEYDLNDKDHLEIDLIRDLVSELSEYPNIKDHKYFVNNRELCTETSRLTVKYYDGSKRFEEAYIMYDLVYEANSLRDAKKIEALTAYFGDDCYHYEISEVVEETVTPESIVVEETVTPESIVVEETVTTESTTVEETVETVEKVETEILVKYWCKTGKVLNLIGFLPSKVKYTPKAIRTFKDSVRKFVFLTEQSISYTLSDGKFDKYEKITYDDLLDQEYVYTPKIGEKHNVFNHLLLNKWLPCGISTGDIKVIINIIGKKQFSVFVDSESLQEFEFWLLNTRIHYKIVIVHPHAKTKEQQDIVYLDPDLPSPPVEVIDKPTQQQIISVKFKESCKTTFTPSKDENEPIVVKAIEGFKPVEEKDTITLIYHNDIWYEWKSRGQTYDLYKHLGIHTKVMIGKVKIKQLLPVDVYRVGKQIHYSKIMVNKLVGNATKGSDPSSQYRIWLKYSEWLEEIKNASKDNYQVEFENTKEPYGLLENKLLQALYDKLVDNSPKKHGEYIEKKPNRLRSKKLRNDQYNKIKKEYSSLFPPHWDSERVKLALKVLTDDYNIVFQDSDLEILEAVIRWVNLQLPPVK